MKLEPVQTEIGRIKDPVERLCAFIRERESMRTLKEAGRSILGKDCVVTEDPILAKYRFCNVRREDDRVTRWVASNWRAPYVEDDNLWFLMLVARFINWPDTLAELTNGWRKGRPISWSGERFLDVMEQRRKRGDKVYSGAYMTRADPESAGMPKATYQERMVFTPMWQARERLQPKKGDTLNSYHMLLGQFHGLGSFMAAQVVADLKYASPLSEASDWWTFAASGPGSRKGLNFVLGRDMNAPWREDDWRMELGRLLPLVNKMLGWSEPLHAQDLQNCLCEMSKYEKTRLGLGRPRARYLSHEISC